MSIELSDAEEGAARYAVSSILHERRIAGRGVPTEVLALHTRLMSDNGHNNGHCRCGEGQLEADDDLIGTAAASLLLDCSERTIRRNAVKLGGVRPDGRTLVFRRSVVVAHRDKKGFSA